MPRQDPAPNRDAELAQRLHTQLGLLLEQAPNFESGQSTAAVLQWLARVEAAIERAGRSRDLLDFRSARRLLGTMMQDTGTLFAPIYNTMAALETRFSSAGSAMFLPAGAPFDTYRALSR